MEPLRLTPLCARLILIGLFALVVVGIRAQRAIVPPSPDPRHRMSDVNLHQRTIERLRAGEPYYFAVGDELRRNHYPTMPIFNWRTPLHYKMVAALSIERAGILLFALAMGVIVTGTLAYAQRSVSKAMAGALFLLGAMLPALMARPGGVVFPENWAGVSIGLSLNSYVANQRMLAAAFGVLAVFLRELAAPYALVCGLLALRARRSHESLLWVIGGVAYAIFYGIHAVAASAAIQPGDLEHPYSWVRWLGPRFVFLTLHTYGYLSALPPLVVPIATAFGLAGAWARSAPEQLTGSLLVYFLLFCVVGQPFDFYWGYVTCAIWAHAFVHSGEGARRLLSVALHLWRRPDSQTSAHLTENGEHRA